MVKVTPHRSSGEIVKIEYENNGFKKLINHKIYTVTNTKDQNNIGTILESYRKLRANAEKYFIENKSTLGRFIEKISISFNDFTPDHIISFLPADKNRNQLLKQFADKVTNGFTNKNDIDFSGQFKKKDASKSIKDGLTANDYVLSLDEELPVIRNLLIIDDTIDKGDTLNIYLDKLFEKKLIDDSTTINLFCIYSNAKSENINYYQLFKDEKNKNK